MHNLPVFVLSWCIWRTGRRGVFLDGRIAVTWRAEPAAAVSRASAAPPKERLLAGVCASGWHGATPAPQTGKVGS